MIRPDVRELFIYDRTISRSLDILKTQRMYCSLASSFNDPFDCAIPFEVDYDPVEITAGWVRLGLKDGRSKKDILFNIGNDLNDDASLTDVAKRKLKHQAERFKSENEKSGIICFTEDPASVLMWSHYGGKHQGMALGFKREFDNCLGDEDACYPVTYSDDFPTPKFSEILYADGRLTEKLMSTKAREWAYEREWRVICDEGGGAVDLPGPICRIIVGCNASKATVESSRAEANRLGLPLSQAVKVEGKFALEIQVI